ncbi:RHS repeat-associated core domain-containing protein, partial [Roseofilum sp. Guam]|uniref:RHS repeat domain-containing protein n=1 Tax=Roseofilum sp. Guam TaxID=2821502 RepID=UPI001B2ED670
DDNGNLLYRTERNETVNYVWDDRNRLIAVEENGERVEFEYDDDNIRVSQTVAGEKTSFLLDKNRPYAQVLAEFVDGEEVASYVYGLDLISQQRNGEDWFYFVDGLGSTRGLTDGRGEVTDAYWYDAYGNLVERVGSSENDYLFAGEQFDEQLGQYYLRQRYYDTATGRFTRRDTYEGRLNEPITLHKYLYAHGNPVNGIDPTGFSTIVLGGAYLAIAAALLIIALAMIVFSPPPERLGGFGEGPGVDIRELESPRPRDPEESLLGRIFSFPRAQPRIPTHTGHPRDNSLDDFISHVFHSSQSVQDIFYPNGQPIGKDGTNGKDPSIREVQGTKKDALRMLERIRVAGGGWYRPKTSYPGHQIQLPNGDIFGVREKMSKSPNTNATLDAGKNKSVPAIRKVKFNP